MTTRENVAIERRVLDLEAQVIGGEPVRVRTTIRLYRRGDEVPCHTIADVRDNAELKPVVVFEASAPDLDVIIEPVTGVHLIRSGPVDPEFDELAEGVRIVDVPISCHADQVEQILDAVGINATTGGARAGKTRILIWWLFRQWLLRGHGVGPDFERAATFWWLREDSLKLYKHAVKWLLDLWPPSLFEGSIPGESTQGPKLHMVGGSVIEFHHMQFSGKLAGINLRSESVDALVVDELSAVNNQEGWRELLNRVAQTGGPIATAYTPSIDHWSNVVIEDAAQDSGGTIKLRTVDQYQNVWWPRARIYLAYLKDAALTQLQLLEVLKSADPKATARRLIKDPRLLAKYFGVKITSGNVLWSEWDADACVVSHPLGVMDYLEVDGEQLPNITALAVGEYFGRQGEGIKLAGGIDFNVNPGSLVVFAVFGDMRAPVIYVCDEVLNEGTTGSSATAFAKAYPDLCAHCDPTGAQSYRHKSHGPKSMSNAEEMRLHGLGCRAANGTKAGSPQHLPQLDSINAMHRLMRHGERGLLLVDERCTGVRRALKDMKAKPDGTIYKVSGRNSLSDIVSGPGDALRYGLWPALRESYGGRGILQIARADDS